MENKELPEIVKQIISQDEKYMSDNISEIVAAIAKATIEMPIPEKSKTGNRGRYSDLEDYLKCCKKVLAKHGVVLHQHPRYKKDTGRVMHSMLLHISGQWLLSTDIANPDKTDEKNPYQHRVSSAFTYAKRRMLQSQLGLGCDDED